MRKIYWLIILLLSLYSCQTQKVTNNKKTGNKNYVLLVSFDGFRYDYPEKFNLPNFQKLKENSSYAKGVKSVFPSKTFPNHYSIITGMYPENHGIVDNKFFVPDTQKIYAIPDRNAVRNAEFYQGIPLWQWLQKKGIKTASYFWVGSEAPITGEYPTYYKNYDSNIPYEDRIQQVMRWFKLPEAERPQLVTLYFEFIDHIGHHTGTNSEELKTALLEADKLLGQILEGVKNTNLPITTIITSDHGMIDMTNDKDKFIIMEEIEKKWKDKAMFINNGMHCQIYLKDKKFFEEVFQGLKKQFADKPFLKVYKKEETPAHWHYKKNQSIGDILLITDVPYYMIKNPEDTWWKKTHTWGTHGYDPHTTPEMMAIFYAHGENIKKNNEIPPFENIHIYPLINHILGVGSPQNIDGKVNVLAPILNNKKRKD